MTTKKKLIILSVFAVAVAAANIAFWFSYVPPSWQRVIDRCINYNPQWLGMRDCYGVIAIFSNWDEPYQSVIKTDAACCDIARINETNDFIINNGQMYLIDITPAGICNNLVPGKYCGDFRTNGESKTYYYDTREEVPRYLIIDTRTGDEKFYVRPQDAPPADQAIFETLIKK